MDLFFGLLEDIGVVVPYESYYGRKGKCIQKLLSTLISFQLKELPEILRELAATAPTHITSGRALALGEWWARRSCRRA